MNFNEKLMEKRKLEIIPIGFVNSDPTWQPTGNATAFPPASLYPSTRVMNNNYTKNDIDLIRKNLVGDNYCYELVVSLPFLEITLVFPPKACAGGYPKAFYIAKYLNGKQWIKYTNQNVEYKREGAGHWRSVVHVDASSIGNEWDFKCMAVLIDLAELPDKPQFRIDYKRGPNFFKFETPDSGPFVSLYRYDERTISGKKTLGQKRFAGFPVSLMSTYFGHSISFGNLVGYGFTLSLRVDAMNLALFLSAGDFLEKPWIDGVYLPDLLWHFEHTQSDACNHISPLFFLGCDEMKRGTCIFKDDRWGCWFFNILKKAGVPLGTFGGKPSFEVYGPFFDLTSEGAFKLFDVFDSSGVLTQGGDSFDSAAFARLNVNE